MRDKEKLAGIEPGGAIDLMIDKDYDPLDDSWILALEDKPEQPRNLIRIIRSFVKFKDLRKEGEVPLYRELVLDWLDELESWADKQMEDHAEAK